MTRTYLLSSILAGALALGGAAFAQQGHGGHGGQGGAAGAGGHAGHAGMAGQPAAKAADTPASAAYRAVNAKMHKDMDITLSGDADVDFVKGMIPHHRGAIDMAKVVLQHGADPQLKTLATSIIADQEKEIAMMRDWLKAKGR